MAIYSWPDTRTFVPAAAELRTMHPTQRVAESNLSGYMQTVSMPGSRWVWQYSFAPQSSAERAKLEGLLVRLGGREHRVSLWDHKRPRPRGVIQLSGVTLGASAAQFGTSLQLAGCRGANFVLNGSFELDSNADGLADRWTRYSSGSAGTLIQARDTSTFVVAGAYSQWINASSLGGTSADQQGIFCEVLGLDAVAGQQVTISAQVLGTPGAQCSMQLAWLNAGGASVGALNSAAVLLNGDSQTVQGSGVCPATAVRGVLYVYQHSGPGGAVGLYIDRVRVEAGAAIGNPAAYATLLAGDWLGLANGQLVMVVADAAANDAGAMTVEVRHMLRSTVASTSAVTLDKPTATFVLMEPGLLLPRRAGGAEPDMAVEFLEVWA